MKSYFTVKVNYYANKTNKYYQLKKNICYSIYLMKYIYIAYSAINIKKYANTST